jgi:hypothetical protein
LCGYSLIGIDMVEGWLNAIHSWSNSDYIDCLHSFEG